MSKITPEREAQASRALVADLDRRRAIADWADYIAPRVVDDLWPAGEAYPDLSELFARAGRHFAGSPAPASAEPGDQDAFLDDVADAVVRRLGERHDQRARYVADDSGVPQPANWRAMVDWLTGSAYQSDEGISVDDAGDGFDIRFGNGAEFHVSVVHTDGPK